MVKDKGLSRDSIEEMARTMCGEKKHTCEECDSSDMCEFWTEASILYSAGYRKQSKGKWKLSKSGCMYFCSCCECAAHPREEEEWNYCPNCGHPMKG